MNEATTTPVVDKAALRARLDRTHEAYKQLIGEIPDARWDAASGNRAFTVGQMSWHLANSVDFAAGLIENARKGKQQYFPRFLMPLGYKINEMRIRRGAKGATRESVLADYARNEAHLMQLLDEVSDSELAIVKTNFAITQSVREMFEIPPGHLEEHAPAIRAGL